MDHALPAPTPLDRRTIVRLVLAGAGAAVLAEAGIPMSTPPDGVAPVDSLERMTASLAHAYDTAGPAKIAAMIPRLENAFGAMLADKAFTTGRENDAKAAYAKLLTLGANARSDTGSYAAAVRTGEMAASLAAEVDDNHTAGHAWTVVSAAMLAAGRPDRALDAAQRAQRYAGATPARPMALDVEAAAAAALGRTHAVLDAVTAMEAAQERVPVGLWGTFGAYHMAHVKAFGGAALARVGLYRDADVRLDEAASLLSGTDGLLVHVFLTRAGVAFAGGDTADARDLASVAVAAAEQRPSSWVVGTVARLNTAARGTFADLVEQTSRWGFAAPGGIRA